jgi:hypothetical protein
MSRTSLSFQTDDLSAFATALGGQLRQCDHVPGHVELLNMLARADGCRNFQHWRAMAAARAALEAPPPVEPAVDFLKLRRMMRLFDAQARLVRWPPKQSERELCLWVLWAAFPARRDLAEAEVNRLLGTRHEFGDHALLRRWLVDLGLVVRTPDGSIYRRVERRPPPEARALIGLLSRRNSAPAEDAGA